MLLRPGTGFGCYLLIFLIFFTACTSSKRIVYFQDVPQVKPDTVFSGIIPDHVIRAGDILQISISSSNSEADQLFNAINRPVDPGNNLNSSGVIVDRYGYIDLPYAGCVRVIGLNSVQAKDSIQKLLSRELKNPTVNFRVVNFQVSVLGDVARPGTYTIANERINILQAIGLSGDLNITARRNNITVIRDEDGKKIFARVDLRSKNLVQSEYFNLRSNDMIYVEPSKGRITQNDARTFQVAALGATILSLITIILTRANL